MIDCKIYKPEISAGPKLFPNGSLTGENTRFSAALGAAAFSALPVVTEAVADALRTTGLAGVPVTAALVPAFARVRVGDGAALVAEGRRAGSTLASVGDPNFALDSTVDLIFFCTSRLLIAYRCNSWPTTYLEAHTFDPASIFTDIDTLRSFIQHSKVDDQKFAILRSKIQRSALWRE